MNSVTRFATLALLTFAATAGAEQSNSSNDRLLVARAELASVRNADPIALDEYVGRYIAGGGVEFFVVRDGDELTIVTPQSWSVEESSLVSEGAGDFVATEIATRVSFVIADGRVNGFTAYPRGATPILAVKAPLRRGTVTIQDVNAQEALTFKSRRGIVTIEDVYDAPRVAAAN